MYNTYIARQRSANCIRGSRRKAHPALRSLCIRSRPKATAPVAFVCSSPAAGSAEVFFLQGQVLAGRVAACAVTDFDCHGSAGVGGATIQSMLSSAFYLQGRPAWANLRGGAGRSRRRGGPAGRRLLSPSLSVYYYYCYYFD